MSVQYVDFAAWQRNWLSGDYLQEQVTYWRDRLKGAPMELSLPVDRPRPEASTFTGEVVLFRIPPDLVRALEELARTEQATLFMVLLAAYQMLLSRYSGQTDIVVGSAAAGRSHPHAEDLIGFFVNTLVLRIDLSGDLSFRQLLQRAKEVTLGAYAHQDVPFEKLVKELHPERSLTRQPLFQVGLALQNVPSETLELAGLRWTRLDVEQGTALFDLTLQLFEEEGGLRGELEYCSDLFDRETAERIARHFRALLDQIAVTPDCSIHQYSLLLAEDEQLISTWEGNAQALSSADDVISVLEQQAEENGENTALRTENEVLTYGDLNASANRLALKLKAVGVKKGDRIGCHVPRGAADCIVAFYGTLKAGAVYVPLEQSQPQVRINDICKDAGIECVLVRRKEDWPRDGVRLELIETEEACRADAPRPENVHASVEDREPAYVIYTSGSTGRPKGVLLPRRGLANVLVAQRLQFCLGPSDRVVQLAALSFDASIFEFMLALGAAGSLELADRERLLPGPTLAEFLRRRNITVVTITPSALSMLSPSDSPSLRTLIVAGEELPGDLARTWATVCRVFNAYGPTETTIWATTHICTGDAVGNRVPIGRAIANTQIKLLDSTLRPVSVGEVGQLAVRGPGVGLGYINRPEVTRERFLEGGPTGSDKLYLTGDLARWRADGGLEFLGRIDNQAKIRGFRIEPGEVEATLQGHPAVKQAAVLAREDSPADRRLVAYVVGDRRKGLGEASESQSDALRRELVSEWEALYENTYGAQEGSCEPNFRGWNNSFTGESIPTEEMEEWLANTVGRIKALKPRRVLEVGCGAGLVLQHVAPDCEVYIATDFSGAAINRLKRWLVGQPHLGHVQVRHLAAHELQDFSEGSFDVVVLNSVVQYFPDADYLLRVMREAVRVVSHAGKIFIGDVRHLGLLRMFHTAVQLGRSAQTIGVRQLRVRIERSVAQEKELLIDPVFFEALPDRVDGIAGADILAKRGHAKNELTSFRYDVILHRGENVGAHFPSEVRDWGTTFGSLEGLENALAEHRWAALRVTSIPNSRLVAEAEAEGLLDARDEVDLAVLRRRLTEPHHTGADPEVIWNLGEQYGYQVQVRWDTRRGPAWLEAQFVDAARLNVACSRAPHATTRGVQLSECTNDPLNRAFRHQLVSELRDYLKRRLPEHMIPSAWVVLQSMPLSSSGKVDRRALPPPQDRADDLGEYVAPRTAVERTFAEIWGQLLRVDQVGANDNFFELGGHSLLAVQLIDQLTKVGFAVNVRDLYGNPRLADFARVVGSARMDHVVTPPSLIPRSCTEITPEMLPLIDLAPEHINSVVETVAGGCLNVEDIYPLAPLQEGMLFHHMFGDRKGDPYVLQMLLYVRSPEICRKFLDALQWVIDRHDLLRTAFVWEDLPQPVQVVWRRATLDVDRCHDSADQIRDRMHAEIVSFDPTKAPLMRAMVADDPANGGSYILLRLHHLVSDHESMESVFRKAMRRLGGVEEAASDQNPYREYIANLKRNAAVANSITYFSQRLAGVTEGTTPFGIADGRADEGPNEEAFCTLAHEVSRRIRERARRLGASEATLFHVVWAMVLSRITGRDDVVFGTVLLGRMHGAASAKGAIGMFLNTLPIRLVLAGIGTTELVYQTQRELAGLLEHEHASLADVQRCSSIQGGGQLFTTLLNYRHSPGTGDSIWNVDADVRFVAASDRTNYQIVLSVDDIGDGFGLQLQTSRQIGAGRLMAYVRVAITALLQALEQQPERQALDLEVLPKEELDQLLGRYRGVIPESAQDRLIHEQFESQARLRPHAMAVSCEGKGLSYAELNAKSNQLAWYLRERGVGPDQLVGICVDRSLEMIVGLLGILKAGGAYVPLDPTYPGERLAYMLDDAAPKVVLTQEHLIDRLRGATAEIVNLDADWEAIQSRPSGNPALRAQGMSGEQLAYVIYTSGSTGKPKGVMVEHRNVVRLFEATENQFAFSERDVWTLFHSYAFDFSVWEIWGALLYGGRVVVVPHMIARSPQEFYRLLCMEKVTILNQTPSAFRQLMDGQRQCMDSAHALRVVVLGGEALELHTLKPWVERYGVKQPQLVNMYGITETTVHVTYARLSRADIEDERSSVIGQAIPDLRVYILDRHGRLAPVGVAGEMYVAGAGVARGYLKRPELTSERFSVDPFMSESAERMYKTGDLGKRRPDGTIEYLGRNDEQVKIRGFRIELGEIQWHLMSQEGVGDAIVLAWEDEPGEKRLVAYVVPARTSTLPSLECLRDHLKAVLPDYMIPSAFVMIEAVPLTANGKLDRSALPGPGFAAHARREYEAPQGEVEELLVGIWQQLLHVERVGRSDNFFELGGHSLSAMRFVARVHDDLSARLTISSLFKHPTVRELAASLASPIHARLTMDTDESPYVEGII
jgi:amino acid adenylation domain-containing protein